MPESYLSIRLPLVLNGPREAFIVWPWGKDVKDAPIGRHS